MVLVGCSGGAQSDNNNSSNVNTSSNSSNSVTHSSSEVSFRTLKNKIQNFPSSNKPKNGDIYASANATAQGDGSKGNPYRLQDALDMVQPGETLWLRGGEYKIKDRWHYPRLTHGGADESSRIVIESYPKETAVIVGTKDFDVDTGADREGLLIEGNYVTLRRLEIKNCGSYGVNVQGSHVLIEGLKVHGNLLTGIYAFGKQNHIRYNEVYGNSDYGHSRGNYNNGDNADAISAGKGSDGTIIEYNIVYGNSDDGIDIFYANNTTIQYNIVYYNGKKRDGRSYPSDSRGNGQGIKGGGENTHNNKLLHNISFKNKSSGFDISEKGNYNCLMAYNTAWKNGDVGFTNEAGIKNIVKNNIAAENKNGPTALRKYGQKDLSDEINNSWQTGENIEFLSTNPNDANFLKPKVDTFLYMGAFAIE